MFSGGTPPRGFWWATGVAGLRFGGSWPAAPRRTIVLILYHGACPISNETITHRCPIQGVTPKWSRSRTRHARVPSRGRPGNADCRAGGAAPPWSWPCRSRPGPRSGRRRNRGCPSCHRHRLPADVNRWPAYSTATSRLGDLAARTIDLDRPLPSHYSIISICH
jgi:hypothetical protein